MATSIRSSTCPPQSVFSTSPRSLLQLLRQDLTSLCMMGIVSCSLTTLWADGAYAEQGGPATAKNLAAQEVVVDDNRDDTKKVPAKARKLNAHVEPKKVPFGKTFHLVISFERPKGVPYALPGTLPSTKTVRASGEVLHNVKGAQQTTDGFVLETFRIPFLALDLSEVKTPSLILRDSHGQTLDIPSLTVEVIDDDDAAPVVKQTTPQGTPHGALPGKATPDRPPNTQAPATQTSFHMPAGPQMFRVDDVRPWVMLGIVLLALLMIGIEKILRKIRIFDVAPAKRYEDIVIDNTLSAHLRALERLDALLAEGLLKRGEIEQFVIRLMDEVLRDYLAHRFALHAENRTTRELAEELLDVGHARLDISLVRDLLEDVDMVKFAKAAMQGNVAAKMAGKVRQLIEETRVFPVDGDLKDGHSKVKS